ncbi:MAG: Gfo/Idh/MocA family oxidoreductase [Akkermansiaceae bacterium]|nr:Gfo/Idh/MocA family oxidoreductase [Akkermansiaceae bacterium]
MERKSPIIRVGVIGTGRFADECHIPCILSHPNAKVVAVCGANSKSLAAKYGISSAMTNYHELCSREDIDAVTIASANSDHADHAVAALTHGKHVLCEKPLAVSIAQAELMTNTASKSNKIHFTAFTFRYNYGIRSLRKRLANGEIGTPFLARIQYDRWDGLTRGPSEQPRNHNQPIHPGMLENLGSHLFDISRHVLGPIGAVIGYTMSIPHSHAPTLAPDSISNVPDDLVGAWMKHTNGVHNQIFISRITPPFAPLGYLEVVGTEGALKASLSRGGIDFIKRSTPSFPEWTDLQLAPEASYGEPTALRRMIHGYLNACISGQLDPEIDASFHDGLAAQYAMSSLLKSQKVGSWTDVQSPA